LDTLLASGKISNITYDQLNKEFARVVEKMDALKEALDQEEDIWRSRVDEQIKILETVLANLEFRRLSGECDVEEWGRMRAILTSGLNSMKNMNASGIRPPSRPAPPSPLKPIMDNEKSLLEDLHEPSFIEEERNTVRIKTLSEITSSLRETQENIFENERDGHSRTKRVKRKLTKSRASLKSDSAFKVHCRNPWKSECKNTDIELSIYYNGEFLPICHRCWQEISEKNLEWSSF